MVLWLRCHKTSKTILKFFDISVFLKPFEVLSHYSNLDSSRWFRGKIKWIIDKFSEKTLWFKWLRQFLLALFYCFFGFCFCCCFHSHKTYYDILLITHAWQTSLFFYRLMAELFYWLLSKAFEFTFFLRH